MSFTTSLTERAAGLVERRTSRRGFVGKSALVGSAIAVGGSGYVLKPGTAYAALCSCPRKSGATKRTCGCGDLCCDGYTEFCCQLFGTNSCPPRTVLAGWWKVDNSSFCDGSSRYYMDCNQSQPACSCGTSGVCKGSDVICQCRSCSNRADGCTVFRYGNCNNDVTCVGPILCRVVTCTKPWEIDPGCLTTARTDPATRNHHRPCLEELPEPDAESIAWTRAVFNDYVGREPTEAEIADYGGRVTAGENRGTVSVNLSRSEVYIRSYLEALYQSVFGRSVDDGGADYWTDRIRGGLKPAEVAAELYGSDEFFRASGSVEAFVGRLYDEILDRSADDDGLQYWADRVRTGEFRTQVTATFYDSVESRRKRVVTLYERFLFRQPDTSGREFWAEQLLDGDDLRLATFLTASEEYLMRAQARFA